jgi:hypothetical protein
MRIRKDGFPDLYACDCGAVFPVPHAPGCNDALAAESPGWARHLGWLLPRLHLHFTGAMRTLCGDLERENELASWWPTKGNVAARGSMICVGSHHFSKARRIDCPFCRAILRDTIRAGRRTA